VLDLVVAPEVVADEPGVRQRGVDRGVVAVVGLVEAFVIPYPRGGSLYVARFNGKSIDWCAGRNSGRAGRSLPEQTMTVIRRGFVVSRGVGVLTTSFCGDSVTVHR
jgi:hypothetical protein